MNPKKWKEPLVLYKLIENNADFFSFSISDSFFSYFFLATIIIFSSLV